MSDANASTEDEALYLLGFSPKLFEVSSIDEADSTGAEAEFIDEQSTSLLAHFGIERIEAGAGWAWYKRIERRDFEGTEGEKNLADIHWLTPRVIAHETVVDQLSCQSAFYPARFGTLFSTEGRLFAFTEEASELLAAYFRRVKGKREWGLKLYGDSARAAAIVAQRNGILQEGRPIGGANYLKLKQLQREHNSAKAQFLDEVRQDATQALQAQFTEMVARPLHGAAKESSREELLSNLAILATPSESTRLVDWAERWNNNETSQTGVRVELTGPWPAYSFCPSLTDDVLASHARRQST